MEDAVTSPSMPPIMDTSGCKYGTNFNNRVQIFNLNGKRHVIFNREVITSMLASTAGEGPSTSPKMALQSPVINKSTTYYIRKLNVYLNIKLSLDIKFLFTHLFILLKYPMHIEDYTCHNLCISNKGQNTTVRTLYAVNHRQMHCLYSVIVSDVLSYYYLHSSWHFNMCNLIRSMYGFTCREIVQYESPGFTRLNKDQLSNTSLFEKITGNTDTNIKNKAKIKITTKRTGPNRRNISNGIIILLGLMAAVGFPCVSGATTTATTTAACYRRLPGNHYSVCGVHGTSRKNIEIDDIDHYDITHYFNRSEIDGHKCMNITCLENCEYHENVTIYELVNGTTRRTFSNECNPSEGSPPTVDGSTPRRIGIDPNHPWYRSERNVFAADIVGCIALAALVGLICFVCWLTWRRYNKKNEQSPIYQLANNMNDPTSPQMVYRLVETRNDV